MISLQKYFVPLLWGIVGMLFAQLFILLSVVVGITFPTYIIIYPLVFFILSFLLNNANPYNWVLNSLLICLIPILFWVWILWNENQLQSNNISIYSDNGMIIVLVISILFSLYAGLIIIRGHNKRLLRFRNN